LVTQNQQHFVPVLNQTQMKTLFWIYRSRVDKLGQSPIMLRLIIGNETKNISTGVKVAAPAWDAHKQRIKGSDLLTAKNNQELVGLENQILDCYYSLLKQMDRVNVRFVVDRYQSLILKPSTKSIPTLLQMYDLHNEEMAQLVGKVYTNATLIKYEMSKDIMRQFISDTMGKQDVELHDVTVSFVKKHDMYLRTVRNNVTNSVTKRLQHLKKVIRYAKQLGYTDSNPFEFVKLSFQASSRTFLDNAELELIKSFKPTKIVHQEVKDVFLFQCYTGIAHCDLMLLTNENIQVDNSGKKWIVFKRKKTNSEVQVPLLPIALGILSKYENHPKGLLLPVQCNQAMNRRLKEIMEAIGIKKNVSTHVGRHSFASSVTLANGIPLEIVSKLLGHSNTIITQVYAKVLPKSVGDAMDRLEKLL
jgi:site-specific recombinase XerD